ncbi:hypothetical protein C8Q80DRAFT_354130 [Daedaleopsis nitida]|nr:hypothetical protein C8Q80DRAFT_354130 [Daedaleopsis nitida]
MSVLARVPIEVFSKIFSLLQGERPSLLSCSLVSIIWHEVSISHLFYAIRFYERQSFASFFEFVRLCPHLAKHVVILTFAGSNPARWAKFNCDQLSAALPNLPALTDIHFSRVAIYSPKPPSSLRAVHKLTTYNVRGCNHPSELGAVALLLRHFLPGTLVVDTIGPWTNSGSTVADFNFLSPQSVPIRQLHLLNSTHHNDWLRQDFFQATLAIDTLHHLTTSCGDRKTIDSLHALVLSAGRNISTMNIDLIYLSRDVYHPPDWDYSVLDWDWSAVGHALSACPNLRRLRLGLLLYKRYSHSGVSPTEGPSPGRLQLPYTEILSLMPPMLTVLVLGLRQRLPWEPPGIEDELGMWDLAQLDKPWFRERFPGLVRLSVKVALQDPVDPLLVIPPVARALSGLHDAGLLRVETFSLLTDYYEEDFAIDR